MAAAAGMGLTSKITADITSAIILLKVRNYILKALEDYISKVVKSTVGEEAIAAGSLFIKKLQSLQNKAEYPTAHEKIVELESACNAFYTQRTHKKGFLFPLPTTNIRKEDVLRIIQIFKGEASLSFTINDYLFQLQAIKHSLRPGLKTHAGKEFDTFYNVLSLCIEQIEKIDTKTTTSLRHPAEPIIDKRKAIADGICAAVDEKAMEAEAKAKEAMREAARTKRLFERSENALCSLEVENEKLKKALAEANSPKPASSAAFASHSMRYAASPGAVMEVTPKSGWWCC